MTKLASPSTRPDDSRDDGAAVNRWLCIARAATLLDMSSSALRRAIERRAQRGGDGVITADFDGIRARKFGRLWRVQLGSTWQGGRGPQ
jgi:hypothetical protein